MISTSADKGRFACVVASARPPLLGTWLSGAFRRLMSGSEVTQTQSTRQREAAQVRAFAQSIRGTDRRYAEDLLAAADHHEALAM
jgi:hypothetical protein